VPCCSCSSQGWTEHLRPDLWILGSLDFDVFKRLSQLQSKAPNVWPTGKEVCDEFVAELQAIAISGQKMSKNEKMAKPLKQWLATLSTWSDDTTLEARIRFKIKDLQVGHSSSPPI
jgi:hypothetical protein